MVFAPPLDIEREKYGCRLYDLDHWHAKDPCRRTELVAPVTYTF